MPATVVRRSVMGVDWSESALLTQSSDMPASECDTGVAGPKRGGFGVGDNYVAMVETLTLTALAFEPWSRVVLLSWSGSKRPTRW